MNSRALAANILSQVVTHNCPLDIALLESFEKHKLKQDRGFVQELCYGVMRWYPRLLFFANELLRKPLKKKDSDVNFLLLLGIYQLDYMRTPEHAAVSATVEACETLNKNWAKKLVNAVLRRYQREKAMLHQRLPEQSSALFAHPHWLIEQIKQDWPQHWSALLENNNQHPPMHLRVNRLLHTREAYIAKLASEEMLATSLPHASSAINLSHAVAVEELPGFAKGHVSVQDLGAQLAVSMLQLAAGLRVLDACAAPGGKVAHMYETEPALGKLVAIDKDAQRCALLAATQARLDTKMQIIEADAADTKNWWDGECFDRILIDAPCSATGVIRRHPDIKLLRQPAQFSKLLDEQSRLLDRLWPLLDSGGRMLYATCSLFKQENDAQIQKHLQNHPDAKLINIDADWGVATEYGRQTLSTRDDTDCFYYAVLEKTHVQ